MRRLLSILLLAAVSGFAASLPEAGLADAVERKDSAAIDQLIAQGAAVNAPQPDGMTALHWAAYHDDLTTAASLMDLGADVTAMSRYGVSPLSIAATNGSGPMVEALLDADADPNTTRLGGETVLMTAARTGKVEAVRALLAHGADVNRAEYGSGQTAVMWAAAEGHADAVELLLAAGAEFKAALPSGFTPLLFAVRNGHTVTARLLLAAGADVNEMVDVKQRVSRGPRTGSTPLHMAVANGHFELAEMLLENGADPNAAEPGYTVLHAITAVRKPGVGDNDPAPQGSGAMTSMQFVEVIAKHGADVNARMTKNVNIGNTRLNKIGATPLMLAAQGGDSELMLKLAELGADPALTNADNSTVLMAAAGIGSRSPGEDAGTEDEVLAALQVALDLGADIDAVDNNGDTAMHGAAYRNHPRAVEFLAEKGADIKIWHTKNTWGWTPLIIAEGYRWGNFKPSPPTIEALHRVMLERGVTPVSEAAVSQEIN